MIGGTEAMLALWGGICGLDLVSVPQAMLSRPLVAGAVAGVIVADVGAGLLVGAALELFALDVLPVGAARYPDYGPATVAAVALVDDAPAELALGLALLLGLGLAMAGGWTVVRLRAANASAVRTREAALAAGDARAVRALQWGGVSRDFARSVLLTAAGVAAARALGALRLDLATALLLTSVMSGGALAAAIHGAWRGGQRTWLGVGLAVGVAMLAVATR